jgi:Winged helix DNA-binding domain
VTPSRGWPKGSVRPELVEGRMRRVGERVAPPDIARMRLLTQGIAGPGFASPEEAVLRLGAVQAQDYPGALWAIGLRTRGATEADVENALAAKRLVRTWPMRGTLHVVHAADVRWMLRLLTPRVLAAAPARWRQLALGEATFGRARDLFTAALHGGRRLTRPAMYRVLEDGGVSAAGQRGIHVLSRLAQEGLLCFAGREGRQHCFALLEEWVPPAPRLERDEALAELALRYFTGHGPATVQDFAWWSGLRAADARAAVEMSARRLARQVIGGETCWSARDAPSPGRRLACTALLPAFDEYLVGYSDQSASLAPAHATKVHHLLSPTVVHDGRVVGTWTRTLDAKRGVSVAVRFFGRSGRPRAGAIEAAARRYGAFVGKAVALPLNGP